MTPSNLLPHPVARWRPGVLAFNQSTVEPAALRDALLPKLISGEIRLPATQRNRAAQAGVNDAEQFLKERCL